MSRILPALLAATSLFLTPSTAFAQRSSTRPPVTFTPASTEVVPWAVAHRNLVAAVRRSNFPRTGANGQREFTDHPRRVRVNTEQVSFWIIRDASLRVDIPLADGELVLIEMLLEKVWAAGVPWRTPAASGRTRPARRDDERDYFRFYFASRSEAEAFLQAWHEARASARGAGNGADDIEAEFARRAALWRARNPAPPLSEAANRHRVLAEDATRAKDYDRAIDEFEAALETDPTWPSGNFNLALLYEAVEDWEEAVRYMRRFLLLEPDSREAAAAREKLILWEDRARREPGRFE